MQLPDEGVKDYARTSYWLESCGDELTPRPALDGPKQVDVAILGAGFSGLWTAYYLLQQDPSLRVAILEQEIAGFGASGRNGGWCSASFPVSVAELSHRYGADATRKVYRAMRDAVDEVGRVAEREGLEIDYHKGGMLLLARSRYQVPLLDKKLRDYQQLGITDHLERLSAKETQARVEIAGALGGVYSPHCARLHPGKLVRGLARIVERLGATLYEQTEVTGFSLGENPAFHTKGGEVRAKVIVLAGEAYLSRLPGLRRQIVPLYSMITLSEPLDQAHWQRLKWHNQECVSAMSLVVDYLTRTQDGRIVFGGRGAPYFFGSSLREANERHRFTRHRLIAAARQWFPSLRGVTFSHSWGGPFGVPRDWMPTVSFDPASGLATARGFGGQGMATTNLAGRILSQLIGQRPSELADLPCVGHRSPNWEPEPLRFLGIRFVQRAYFALEARAERSGVPPSGNSLAERWGRH